MKPFQPPVAPYVVAVPMDDYLHHTRTDWSDDDLTARAEQRWQDMHGEFTNTDNPSCILLTEAQAAEWRDGATTENP